MRRLLFCFLDCGVFTASVGGVVAVLYLVGLGLLDCCLSVVVAVLLFLVGCWFGVWVVSASVLFWLVLACMFWGWSLVGLDLWV